MKGKIIKAYCVFSLSLFVSFLECICYNYWIPIAWQPFWFALVLLTLMALIIIRKYGRNSFLKSFPFEAISIISTLFLFNNIISSWMRDFINNHLNWITFIILINGVLGVFVFRKSIAKKETTIIETNESKKLFNIFYLNTSKAHEIAMLIDNKIMKSIEKEQTTEERLQQSNTLSLGGKNKTSVNSGITFENNFKNRVFESFDVKSTKSIMLRKIYESVSNNHSAELQVGSIKVFENVELQQVNVDDTVMILNILQDSKIHN